MNPPRTLRPAALLVAALLAGCAAQTAFKDGQELLRQGRTAEGLAKLEEANRLDPGSLQYRAAITYARERAMAAQLQQADQLRKQGKLQEAEDAVRQLLALDPGNDRALAALRSLDRQRRIEGWMRDAQAAMAKQDAEAARTLAKSVLLEEPAHEGARRLLQKIEEERRPPPDTALSQAYRKPITIEFKDAPLRTVFEVISRSSGLNFLFDKDVKTDQKTSIFLKNSTIEAAVNLTLLTNQLDQRVLDANTILIYPNTQAKQKDYQPLAVRSFYLANAEAKAVGAAIKTLLKLRDVVVDDKLNLLIVRDSLEAIRLAEKLVALHDLPEPEVMLEVEILEVKRTRLLDLGIRWPDQLSLAPLASGSGTALTVANLRNLNSNAIGATVAPTTLVAKKVDTDANILANPRIRARNREKAKILIGERVPNITTTSGFTGFVSETVNYVDIGLKLDVEPTIYLDGEVAIKIALEVSNIVNQLQTKSGSIAYQIGTRTAQTVLRLKDGENQVLAGLINDEDRRSANKVPALGDVPVVGRLFGNQADDASKTEIVLSITPRVLRNVQRPEGSLIEFDSGTESSFGSRVGAASVAGGGSPSPIATPAALPAPAPTPAGAPAAAPSSAPAPASANPTPVPVSATPATNTPGAAAAATLAWSGPGQLKVGDTFALQLVMQAGQPVVSVPMALGFDPRVLQVTSVTEGDFLKQDGGRTSFASRVDPTGQILITGTRAGDTGATAAGALATVNFRVNAAAEAETRIQVLTVAPIGLGGRSVNAPLPPPHVLRVTGEAAAAR